MFEKFSPFTESARVNCAPITVPPLEIYGTTRRDGGGFPLLGESASWAEVADCVRGRLRVYAVPRGWRRLVAIKSVHIISFGSLDVGMALGVRRNLISKECLELLFGNFQSISNFIIFYQIYYAILRCQLYNFVFLIIILFETKFSYS